MGKLTCSAKGCKNNAVMGTVEEGQFCADHVPTQPAESQDPTE